MAIRIETRPSRSLRSPRRATRPKETDRGDLEKSIKRFGVLQPIVTRRDGEVVIGERRWQAAKRAGLDVPVIIRTDLDDETAALEARLSEEMSHEPWDRVALAEEIRKLFETCKKRDDEFTRTQLADRLGVSESTLGVYFTLAGMPEAIKEEVHRGELTARDAREIARLTELTEAEKVKLAKKVAGGKVPHGITLREEVAPLIRKAPETVRAALIKNPSVTFAEVQRHIKRSEEKDRKASAETGQSIRGFAAGVIQRVHYWRTALHSLQKSGVLPLFSEYDWVRFDRGIHELIEEAQECLKARNKETLREAKALIEEKPERARKMVQDAEGRWVAATEA